MRRAIGAAVLGLLLLALPATAKPVDPTLTLDTPEPYHYGDVIIVTAHGDIPGKPGEQQAKARIFLTCQQDGGTVYSENLDSPAAETHYTFHLGQWGLSQWDLNGGGEADCSVRLTTLGHGQPGIVFTRILFHVEA